MKSVDCSRKARDRIDNEVRRELAQLSNFACSICGSIPIVFHHIKHWSKNFSNDKTVLIPICDKCHRGIHGEGGNLFNENELYEFKANPKRPPFLSDKLPLERKKFYAFFVGSNFVANGERASFFSLPDGQNFLTVDTSSGNLMLTVLAEVNDGKAVYLIQNNELMIYANEVWDMHYSRSAIKIWRVIDGKKTVFIDLVIKPDLIILREMKTAFDGRPFRIYRYRKPQQRQLKILCEMVKQYEALFYQLASQIDSRPRVSDTSINGIDFDSFMRETEKNIIKTQMENELAYEFCHEFAWDWRYYQWVLGQVFAESPVFTRTSDTPTRLPDMAKPAYELLATMKAKYQGDIKGLEGTVAEYNGRILMGNVLA